jgi:hypothetical protein
MKWVKATKEIFKGNIRQFVFKYGDDYIFIEDYKVVEVTDDEVMMKWVRDGYDERELLNMHELYYLDESSPSFSIEDMNKLFKYFNNQLYENEGVCFSIDHFHAYMKENYPNIQIDAL